MAFNLTYLSATHIVICAGYLGSTDDKRRLSGRESTTDEICSARTFCSDSCHVFKFVSFRFQIATHTSNWVKIGIEQWWPMLLFYSFILSGESWMLFLNKIHVFRKSPHLQNPTLSSSGWCAIDLLANCAIILPESPEPRVPRKRTVDCQNWTCDRACRKAGVWPLVS